MDFPRTFDPMLTRNLILDCAAVRGPLRDEELLAMTSAIIVAEIWSGGGFLTVLTLNLRLRLFRVLKLK
jgi:hypothetical protein